MKKLLGQLTPKSLTTATGYYYRMSLAVVDLKKYCVISFSCKISEKNVLWQIYSWLFEKLVIYLSYLITLIIETL